MQFGRIDYQDYYSFLFWNSKLGNATSEHHEHHVGVSSLVYYSWFGSQMLIFLSSYFSYWNDVLYNRLSQEAWFLANGVAPADIESHMQSYYYYPYR